MYTIEEAHLDLPPPVQDRSVNVLGYIEPGTQTPFQIIINRDELLGGETVPECFNRQLQALTRQAKQFKVIRREEHERPDGLQPLFTVESSFQQAGRAQHQLQCMVVTQAPKLLVLTLSSAVALNQGHREFWEQLLERLDPVRLPPNHLPPA